jgi:hypothetical protein
MYSLFFSVVSFWYVSAFLQIVQELDVVQDCIAVVARNHRHLYQVICYMMYPAPTHYKWVSVLASGTPRDKPRDTSACARNHALGTCSYYMPVYSLYVIT